MTDQEAEALVERLGRIWPVNLEKEASWQNTSWEDSFVFLAALEDRSSLDVQKRPGELFLAVKLTSPLPFFLSVRLESDGSLFPNPLSDEEEWNKFQHQQMRLFRRNCWLSGGYIEASAHEKAEWLQGFKREGVGAWKLKF